MNPIVTAQYGMLAAGRRFEASAERTAGASLDSDVDLGREATEQVEAKTAFSANVAVLRTADRMQRDVLDILA